MTYGRKAPNNRQLPPDEDRGDGGGGDSWVRGYDGSLEGLVQYDVKRMMYPHTAQLV